MSRDREKQIVRKLAQRLRDRTGARSLNPETAAVRDGILMALAIVVEEVCATFDELEQAEREGLGGTG